MNNFALVFIGIIILIFITLALILFIAWSAKKTLIRGGVAWSARELPLKRNKKPSTSSLLKEIEIQSEEYLKEQAKK